MNETLSEDQKKNIESLQFENQKATSKMTYLASRLGQREIELAELEAQLQVFRDAYSSLKNELDQLKDDEKGESNNG